MNLFQSHINLSTEVAKFLLNCTDVKEESVTDYLVWKWSELDKRFKHININTFTRQEENKTTGADYELELWLIDREFCLPLVIQAKKFIKNFDSYHAKLNYPNKTQNQLNKLLSYAKSKRRLPFYVFYSLPNNETRVKCVQDSVDNTKSKNVHNRSTMNRDSHFSEVHKLLCYDNSCSTSINLKNVGVFIADAYTIKNFADKKPRTKISKNDLLRESSPLHCIFCGLPFYERLYFWKYFRKLSDSLSIPEDMPLPDYVDLLLRNQTSEMKSDELAAIINQNELHTYRHVAVYDMHNID